MRGNLFRYALCAVGGVILASIVCLRQHDLLAWAVRHKDTLLSEVTAAWVQAVGSVGAILVAIWVSRRQFSDARALDEQRRHQELKAFLQAIHAELQTLWAGYNANVGSTLPKVPDDGAFMYLWTATIEAFTIYNVSAATAPY